MLELYMIRHGLAGSPLDDESLDETRPLKKKGKEKMKEIAKGLKELKITFDIVLTSPLLRALESAEIVNAYCGKTKDVTVTELLAPGSSHQGLIRLLNKHKDLEKVAIVGHEPFLSGFASYCIAKSISPLINLKKGGALMLEVDQVIKPGRCILSWLMEPKQMILRKGD